TSSTESPYEQPNQLMGAEIDRRIDQIPYLHREELLDNLLWLSQSGEQCIPALLKGLKAESPKVRSSSAWVLGRLRDRRTIPALRMAVSDSEPTVQFECARTLVLLGDLEPAPVLISGLDSERKEVRYLCHEALKTATGHDFGFDHLAVSQEQARSAVFEWRKWWSDYSGDQQFAMSYAEQHGIGPAAMPATPMGESQMTPPPAMPPQQDGSMEPTPNAAGGSAAGVQMESTGNTKPIEIPSNGAAPSSKNAGGEQGGESQPDGSRSILDIFNKPIATPPAKGSPESSESATPGKATVVPVIEIPAIEGNKSEGPKGQSSNATNSGTGSGNGSGSDG
ncbi:MAG: HEAT repeat domain-containing protein, partial [bacterium]|nr:HEAT repeat domain-containing protein [bacterium]